MTFDQGNGIVAHFDFQFYYDDIPDGVDFKVEEFGSGYRLTAFGYGVLGQKDSYGSGALYVYRSDLTPEQDASFREGLGYIVSWGGKVRTQERTPDGRA